MLSKLAIAAARGVLGRYVDVDSRPGKRTELGDSGGWSETAATVRVFILRREAASRFSFVDGRAEHRLVVPGGYIYLDQQSDRVFVGHGDGSPYGKSYLMVGPSDDHPNCGKPDAWFEKKIGPVRVLMVRASDVKARIRARFGDKKTIYERLCEAVEKGSSN